MNIDKEVLQGIKNILEVESIVVIAAKTLENGSFALLSGASISGMHMLGMQFATAQTLADSLQKMSRAVKPPTGGDHD